MYLKCLFQRYSVDYLWHRNAAHLNYIFGAFAWEMMTTKSRCSKWLPINSPSISSIINWFIMSPCSKLIWSVGIAGDKWCPLVPQLCSTEPGHSLWSQSAWLSPAVPPSASSPSPLSSGPLTRRHYSTQRRGVSDDTVTTRLRLNKVNRHAW